MFKEEKPQLPDWVCQVLHELGFDCFIKERVQVSEGGMCRVTSPDVYYSARNKSERWFNMRNPGSGYLAIDMLSNYDMTGRSVFNPARNFINKGYVDINLPASCRDEYYAYFPDPNALNNKQQTALMALAERNSSKQYSDCNDIQAIDELLKVDANIDAQHPETGMTALMYAARNGHYYVMKYLLEHGANPHLSDKYNQNALHYAVIKDDISCARLLLKYGINLNQHSTNIFYLGKTPLQVVASSVKKREDIIMMELLVMAGANPNLSTKNGCNSKSTQELLENNLYHQGTLLFNHLNQLYKKYQTKDFKISYDLSDGLYSCAETMRFSRSWLEANLYVTNRDDWIFAAVCNNFRDDHEYIKELISVGYDLDYSFGKEGNTILITNVMNGRKNTVEFLCQNGADCNRPDYAGKTPLFHAFDNRCFSSNTLACAELLLKNGADPNIRDEKGNTVLFYAMNTNLAHDAVKLLCAYGANPNIPNNQGITPLMYAVGKYSEEKKKTHEQVQILLECGGNVWDTNPDGKNILEISRYDYHELIKQAQQSQIEQQPKEEFIAAKKNVSSVTFAFLKAVGANNNFRKSFVMGVTEKCPSLLKKVMDGPDISSIFQLVSRILVNQVIEEPSRLIQYCIESRTSYCVPMIINAKTTDQDIRSIGSNIGNIITKNNLV